MKETIQPIVNLLVAGDIQARYRDPNMIEVELIDGTTVLWVTMPSADSSQPGSWGVMALDTEGALSESQKTECSVIEAPEEVAKFIANWDYHIEHQPDALDGIDPMVAVEMPVEPSAEEAKVLDNPPPLEEYAEITTHEGAHEGAHEDGPGPAEGLMGAPNPHHDFYADPVNKKHGAEYSTDPGFVNFISAAYRLYIKTDQRQGQAYFTVLTSMRPELADEVRSVVGLDPFYDDNQIGAFLTWLAENWNEPIA